MAKTDDIHLPLGLVQRLEDSVRALDAVLGAKRVTLELEMGQVNAAEQAVRSVSTALDRLASAVDRSRRARKTGVDVERVQEMMAYLLDEERARIRAEQGAAERARGARDTLLALHRVRGLEERLHEAVGRWASRGGGYNALTVTPESGSTIQLYPPPYPPEGSADG